MSAVLSDMKREWQQFKHDAPGERFRRHHRRAQQGSHAAMIGRAVLGIALLVGGVVLLFVPGPGLLLLVFGVALIAGLSRRFASLLDRAEPHVRAWAHSAKLAWKRMPLPAHVAIVAAAVAVAALAAYAAWRVFIG